MTKFTRRRLLAAVPPVVVAAGMTMGTVIEPSAHAAIATASLKAKIRASNAVDVTR